jgi:low temperature requirement protein LtrA
MNKSPAEKSPADERLGRPSVPVLLRLLNKASLLASLFCLLTLILYAAGIRQDFADSTQLAVIQCAVYGGVALLILSLYRFFAGLWFSMRCRRPLLLAKSLGFLALGALGALVAAALSFMAAVAGGNV